VTETEGSPTKRSSALLLVAGAVVAVYSSLYAVEAFAGSYPSARDVIGPVGYIVAFVGLIGLYPAFADRTPKLATGGAVFAGIGIVGYLMTIVGSFGVLSSEPAWFRGSMILLILSGMILAYLLLGVASLRSGVYSRTLGLSLLAPVPIMGLNLGVVVTGYSSAEARFLVSGLWALSFLAIGATLRTERDRTDASGSPTETVA
jgi:hypothetical protein